MSRTFSDKFSTLVNSALLHLGLQGGNGIAMAAILLGSILLSMIMILTGGSTTSGISFIAVVIVAFCTFYRLDWGFYIFITAVLVADNFEVPGYLPWTIRIGYFATINAIKPGLAIGFLTPMEIHLLFLIVVWILMIAVKNDRPRAILVGMPAGLFYLWLLISVVYGIVTGGDALKAFWQLRSLLCLGILYAFVPQIIFTKKQVTNIMWVIICTIGYKAFQAADRFVGLGFAFGEHRALAAHEDPILLVTVFLFLFCLISFGGSPSQRRAMLWLLPVMLLGFYAANRRAAYICLLICMSVPAVLVPQRVRGKVVSALIVGGILFGIYLAVYWNDEFSASAQFAQAVRSAVSKDRQEMRRDDYYSNLSRDHENYNLSMTLHRLPFGLGFGKQHDWIINNYGPFSLRGYFTHNQVFWLLVTSGPIGFLLFFFFMNSVLFNGSMILSKLRDPYLMAVCATCMIAIPNHIIHTYSDMGFSRARSTAYLGILIGLISVVKRADDQVTTPPKKESKYK